MAEKVEFYIERSLPQLEQLERVGIFTHKEIKAVIKNRRALEYKLKRPAKNKEDFLKYIQYEINLMNLIKKRRLNIGYQFKKSEIDHSIAQGINRLFKAAIFRYQDDVNLWLSHIEFLKKLGWTGLISNMFVRMLQVHNGSPNAWLAASKWEFEGNNSPDTARSLMQRALRFHPNSVLLWSEYFKMELLYSEKVRKRRAVLGVKDEETEESQASVDVVMSGKIALIVYRNAIEEVNDLSLKILFLEIACQFDFTADLEEEISQSIATNHEGSELALDVFARRCLLRLQEKIKTGAKSGDSKAKIVKKLEVAVFDKYEESVQELNTEKMWSLYIEACFGRLSSSSSEKHAARILHRIMTLLQRAYDNDSLSEHNFKRWIQLCEEAGDSAKLMELLEIGIGKYSSDVDYWMKFISLHIQESSGDDEIKDLFDRSLKNVTNQHAVTLWEQFAKFLHVRAPQEVEQTLKNGILACRSSGINLQLMYLDFSAFQSGLKAAQRSFKWLQKHVKLSPEVVDKIVLLEQAQTPIAIENIRSYYEAGILQFGSSNIDIWLNYIELEARSDVGKKTNCGNIYWRAVKYLEPSIVDEFISRHTIMKNK